VSNLFQKLLILALPLVLSCSIEDPAGTQSQFVQIVGDWVQISANGVSLAPSLESSILTFNPDGSFSLTIITDLSSTARAETTTKGSYTIDGILLILTTEEGVSQRFTISLEEGLMTLENAVGDISVYKK